MSDTKESLKLNRPSIAELGAMSDTKENLKLNRPSIAELGAMSDTKESLKLNRPSVTELGAMSDTKESLKLNRQSVTELGALAPASHFSSTISLEEKEKFHEQMKSNSCHACKLMEQDSCELKKRQDERKLEHQFNTSGNELGKESPYSVNAAGASRNYNPPLSDRLPFLKFGPKIEPPEPMVKRLKGDFAKSVGRKIDGSNWDTLLPDACDNPPEISSARGQVK